jgi:hypothetical protein
MEIVGTDGQAPQGQQKPLNINLAEQPDIKCVNCEGLFFEQAMQFKKVSKLLTGSPTDQVAPIQVFRCMDCGMPCEELMPDGV